MTAVIEPSNHEHPKQNPKAWSEYRRYIASFSNPSYAAKSNRFFWLVIPCASGQNNVTAFDFGKFFQQCSRSIAQAGSLHPLSQAFPQYISQKANQDMCFDSVSFLMPNRADNQFVFGNTEGPFGFSQLDISFPKCLWGDVGKVGSQKITSFGQLSPIAPLFIAFESDFKSRLIGRIFYGYNLYIKGPGGTPITLLYSS